MGVVVCEAVAHRAGTAGRRDASEAGKGTPQGSAISQLLSNLFMHYAFDSWLDREFPMVRFERYCDDAVIHCATERQAEQVREAIGDRLGRFGLTLHPAKTRIVYCKQEGRDQRYPVTEFSSWGSRFGAGPLVCATGGSKWAFCPR